MSLEDVLKSHTEALERNTRAVEQLTANLSVAGLMAGGTKPTTEAKPVAEKAAAPKATVVKKPAEVAKPEAPTDKAVVYEDVQAVVGELVTNKGKETTLEVLGHFHVVSAKNLEPSQWADFVKAAKAKLAEVDAPAEEELA